ncbi:MAG: enoyl-CoA hydratase/isomerase family protein [Deltaproteobacteria bacterium]|nr:MAG: enoyl-CoA hydratase/isomerase family protein [Deltaproteobacteria bacterium]
MNKEYKTIKVEEKEQIVTITLNRPEKKNALNLQFDREMLDLMEELAADEDKRVLIITGAGDTFCAGRDLKEFFAETHDKPREAFRNKNKSIEFLEKFRLFSKPVIAAVNGPAYGMGVRLMAYCDFAIASEKAVFGLSEVNFGRFPAGGATKAVVDLLAHRDALYMILTGEAIDAMTAERWRLVNKTVPHDKLMEETLALADKLKTKDPAALMFAKEVFWASKFCNVADAVTLSQAKVSELRLLQGDEGLRTGIDKFLKKEYKPSLRSFLEKE